MAAYHYFDNEICELFSYVFLREGSMAINIVLCVRKHAVERNSWRRVRVWIKH